MHNSWYKITFHLKLSLVIKIAFSLFSSFVFLMAGMKRKAVGEQFLGHSEQCSHCKMQIARQRHLGSMIEFQVSETCSICLAKALEYKVAQQAEDETYESLVQARLQLEHIENLHASKKQITDAARQDLVFRKNLNNTNASSSSSWS